MKITPRILFRKFSSASRYVHRSQFLPFLLRNWKTFQFAIIIKTELDVYIDVCLKEAVGMRDRKAISSYLYSK